MNGQEMMVHRQLVRTEEALRAAVAEAKTLRGENTALREAASAVLERAVFERNADGVITRCDWRHCGTWHVWTRDGYLDNDPFVSALVGLREALGEVRGEARKAGER